MIAFGNGTQAAVDQTLADLRAWRDQIEEFALGQSTELAAERSTVAALSNELEKLRRQVKPLELRAEQLRQERDAALKELEKVLERSAAVTEEASRQRRLFATERGELEAELRAMRRVLMQHELSSAADARSVRSAFNPPSNPTVAAPTAAVPAAGPSEGNQRESSPPTDDGNSVADVVAAQFAAIKNRRPMPAAGRQTGLNARAFANLRESPIQ